MWRVWVGVCLAVCFASSAMAQGVSGSVPADEAVQQLKAGNSRYAAGNPQARFAADSVGLVAGKGWPQPLAVVLSSSDMMVPAEAVFDQSPGGICSVRVAGLAAGAEVLASLEDGVAHLGAPVVFVLGSLDSRLMDAAMRNARPTGVTAALSADMRKAVAKAREWSPTATGGDLREKAVRALVWQAMETILRKSVLVRTHVQDGRALLLGGVHDPATGQVAWLGRHPEQGRILAAIWAAAHKPKPKPKPQAEPVKAQEQGGTADSEGAAQPMVPEAVGAAVPGAEGAAGPQTSQAKDSGERTGGAHAKPQAKPPAKPAAKPQAKAQGKAQAKGQEAASAESVADPNARSQGEGELLLPEPEKTPAKAQAKPAQRK